MADEAILQMLDGKNKILLFREFGETKEAEKLVFQMEHTFSYSRELNRIVTKDGTVVKVGGLESEVDISAIQAKRDPVGAFLQNAVIKGRKLEIWEVTVDEDLEENGKYPAVYAQGYLENWEPTAASEDEAEVSGTFIVELEPQFGMTALSTETLNAVQYAFTETDELPDNLPNDPGIEG